MVIYYWSRFEAWLSLVERCVRDAEVASSNLVASTHFSLCLKKWPHGQAVKTTPSHGVNSGSIPDEVIESRIKAKKTPEQLLWCFCFYVIENYVPSYKNAPRGCAPQKREPDFCFLSEIRFSFFSWASGIRTLECRSQSPVPYRLAMAQWFSQYKCLSIISDYCEKSNSFTFQIHQNPTFSESLDSVDVPH